MRPVRTLILALGCGLFAIPAPSLAEGLWITHPKAAELHAKKQAISLQFRRTLNLDRHPRQYRVKVSADNRFILFVNGQRVAAGPARADLQHWRYENIDLAPFLKAGRNLIAAQVWNDEGSAPAAQISDRTGFFLEAIDSADSAVDSGPGWAVRLDESRSVSSAFPQIFKTFGDIEHHYYSAGAPEVLKAQQQTPGWETARDSRTDWQGAVRAVETGAVTPWTLVENPLPQMRYQRIPSGRAVRSSGANASRFPISAVRIPANSEATILIDAGRVLAAYPELVTSGGTGARITLTYTEALYDAHKVRLANRASIDGQVLGISDQFLPDGGSQRRFAPFWYRVWRFAELKVKTGPEPLVLNAFRTYETGYPFAQRATFKSSDPELDAIWKIGWRTTLLDAHETFMDTSYWEQTQYVGDTRIEALISYAVSGDMRLGIQALDAFNASRVVDGFPQGAWPVNGKSSIPPFGLIWIGMLHDYWLRSPDPAPVRRNLEGARAVLDWYGRHRIAGGLIRDVPGWQFIDWRPSLSGRNLAGKPPKEPACVISLLYLGAMRDLAQMETDQGDASRSLSLQQAADGLSHAIRAQCWDASRGLFADNPDKDNFSQQGNALAILYDVAPKPDQAPIFDRILVPNGGIDAPSDITPVTYYFAFYLARALDHAGQGDRYPGLLGAWRNMLKMHFTTWPEEPDPSRSDTHAWSAHPTADLLAIVAGINPGSPGYRTVRITPHLGNLSRLDVSAPHPQGMIKARYRRGPDGLRATIALPPGISGTFAWNGVEQALHSGDNSVSVPNTR